MSTTPPDGPVYDLDHRYWIGTCPCVVAEQRDPECQYHGREATATTVPNHGPVLVNALENTCAALEETTDPRGDAACPECPEGEVIPLAFSRFGVQVAVCDVCGFSA